MSRHCCEIFLPELRPYFVENLRGLAPHTIFWRESKYDTGMNLDGLATVRVTPRTAFRAGWATSASTVIVPEPLWFRQYPVIVPFVLGVIARKVLRRGQVQVGTYCIDNARPERLLKLPEAIPVALRVACARAVVLPLWSCMDKVVFGTRASQDTYAAVVPSKAVRRAPVVLPRPRAQRQTNGSQQDFAFVGVLDKRKGIPLMLAAWDIARTRMPGARLRIAGIGELASEVEEWAKARPEVELTIDATRDEVFTLLQESGIHLQLSMPGTRNGEQVGSSNLEALSCGLRLVVTPETGIASWLKELGHEVVPCDISAEGLADVLVEASCKAWSAPAETYDSVDGYVSAHLELLS